MFISTTVLLKYKMYPQVHCLIIICRSKIRIKSLTIIKEPSWANPALLRFVLEAALFAFKLRGEQLALLALPRNRAAKLFIHYFNLSNLF